MNLLTVVSQVPGVKSGQHNRFVNGERKQCLKTQSRRHGVRNVHSGHMFFFLSHQVVYQNTTGNEFGRTSVISRLFDLCSYWFCHSSESLHYMSKSDNPQPMFGYKTNRKTLDQEIIRGTRRKLILLGELCHNPVPCL